MKDVLLITHYYHFSYEKESSRYKTLCDMLSKENGVSLELVTSSFYHRTKIQRDKKKAEASESFKVTIVHEPSYQKNISIKRLFSSRVFASNVISYLRKRKKPDLIYQVVPSLDVADVVTLYAKKNGIPLIIDIQDLWPEAFRMAIDVPIFSDILFAPMMKKANRIYSRADAIVAVSDTYVNRGLSVNPNCTKTVSAYIGGDVDLINKNKSKFVVNKPYNEFWVSYAGTLSHSYDIELVINALDVLKKRQIGNIVFHVMGDGILREKFEKISKARNIKAVFHGHVPYGFLMLVLEKSDIAVNPIISKSVASIINKVSDYALSGLPVVNTQVSTEYRKLLSKYEAGISIIQGDFVSLADAIQLLYSNRELLTRMKQGAKILANERFNRSDTYISIVNLIKDMIGL